MLSADTFLLNQRNRSFIEGRAQRPVSPTGLPGCIALFLVPFLICGAFTVWLAFDSWYRLVGFAVAPRSTEAMIIDKGISPDDEGDDDPYLVYRYSAQEADGAGRYTDRAYVSWGDYEAFSPEDVLTVEYIAYSPHLSRVAGATGRSGLGEAAFATFFTLFWNGITVPMFILTLRSRARSRRLRREGRLVHGTLTRYETSTDSDNDLSVKIAYSFMAPNGQWITGVDDQIRNELRNKPAPPAGTPLAVLYVDEKTHSLL